jgi:hypothetical protein
MFTNLQNTSFKAHGAGCPCCTRFGAAATKPETPKATAAPEPTDSFQLQTKLAEAEKGLAEIAQTNQARQDAMEALNNSFRDISYGQNLLKQNETPKQTAA